MDHVSDSAAEGLEMSITVIYSTEAFVAKNGGNAGTMSETTFNSLAEALASPPERGADFACIRNEDGYLVYTRTLGWEQHSHQDIGTEQGLDRQVRPT